MRRQPANRAISGCAGAPKSFFEQQLDKIQIVYGISVPLLQVDEFYYIIPVQQYKMRYIGLTEQRKYDIITLHC
jgi:hypothetical protein